MKIQGWRSRAYCVLPDLKLSRLERPERPENTRPLSFGGSCDLASPSRCPASDAVVGGVLRTWGYSIATPIPIAMAPNPASTSHAANSGRFCCDRANFQVGPIVAVR